MDKESACFWTILRINTPLMLTILIVAAIITATLPVLFSKIAYAQATTIVNLNPLETFSAKG
jgi:hypothetical protein